VVDSNIKKHQVVRDQKQFENHCIRGNQLLILDQGSATFPESRAKNKLCQVWRTVLIFHQQLCSLCCLCCW